MPSDGSDIVGEREHGFAVLRRAESVGPDWPLAADEDPEPLPPFLRRERLPDATFGIVAHAGHPLLARTAAPDDLADCPWIDFGAPTGPGTRDGRPSLSAVLDDMGRFMKPPSSWMRLQDAAGLTSGLVH